MSERNPRQRGNRLGIWFFEIMLRVFGLKGAYFLLEFVCAYYLLFDREAVNTALIYIEKRFPQSGRWQKAGHIHRLFVSQGRQLIDRYAMIKNPDIFRYREIGTEETVRALHESKKGLVVLTSHAGNWQVALRQLGWDFKKKVCIVMRPENNRVVQEFLQIRTGGRALQIINPEGHLGGVLEMMQALEEGSVVCLMGDRSYGFDSVEVPFLGKAAYFPYGAFSIAAAGEYPVVALLTHKVSEREYVADISSIWYPAYVKGENKKEQLKKWVAGYVKLLETFVKQYPYECFLFHNVWVKNKGISNDN